MSDRSSDAETRDDAPLPSVSVILPLYNAAHLLPRVLPPLEAASAAGEVIEVLVVDDGSTDDGPAMCRERGFEVIPSGGRLGPGGARNEGARHARGDVLLFIDSDVVMHDGVPGKMARAIAGNERCVAVFGSYDDSPAAPGMVSRYRNLLHHFVHHQGKEEASTFWAGCGAIRREAYLAVDGFDLDRYPYPSIEDIELGHRLRTNGGRILLKPEIQGTHLKKWTLRNMVFTDVFRRAIPWSRLMNEPGYEVQDLNVTTAEKLKAVVAGLFAASLAASPFEPRLLILSAVLLAVAWAVNARFFALVRRRFGIVNMAVAVLLHQLYYLYSMAAFVFCKIEALFKRR